ncbi:MAG: membrane protein insertion efficiency factor YidD [Pyrinomonadaceae bacterium]|nr:membrane protein insertion efficiency factor YidD [Phycisphaerales bacterium]
MKQDAIPLSADGSASTGNVATCSCGVASISHRSFLTRAFATPFILFIRLYQLTLSPWIGGQCRFIPTCSAYAIEAYQLHGPIKGTWLTFWRLCRCHPFGGGGYDPPPLPRDVSRKLP